MNQPLEALDPHQIPYLTTINDIRFTLREIDVLACLLNGKTAKAIAKFLNIAPRTAETHISNIMNKLGCHSKEGILQFIEQTTHFAYFKNHYLQLRINYEFQEVLIKIKRYVLQNKEIKCFLITDEAASAFLSPQFICGALTSAGIHIQEKNGLFTSEDITNTNYVIYLSSQNGIEEKTFLELEMMRNRGHQNPGLLLISGGKEKQIHASTMPKAIVYSASEENKYFAVLNILKSIVPATFMEPIIAEFKDNYAKIIDPTVKIIVQKEPKTDSETKNSTTFVYSIRQHRYVFILLFTTSLITSCFFLFLQIPRNTITTSELVLPTDSNALKRPQLIAEIDRKLKSQKGIKTVALVGIGGAGKTVLARQYAKMQHALLIWEVNAETRATLLSSFEELAYAISKSSEEKEELERIKKLENIQERFKKLLPFVKQKLKNLKEWYLVFDNVENFADIQSFFPNSVEGWGIGKVLITTRNRHIQDNPYIDNRHVVQVLPLDAVEKQTLFTKIMDEHNSHCPHPVSQQQLNILLKNIPPFPLDISIAAYFIKHTKITYTEYLARIRSYDKEFEKIQTNFLKEISDYTKTRYGITISTIQSLIETCPEFTELLLLISLMESQNIPKNLLETHKDKDIVTHFIHHMKKHSLITLEESSDQPLLSIHRSTQEIILHYLIQSLSEDKKGLYIDEVIATLEKYSDNLIANGDIPQMRTFLKNLSYISNHKSLLSNLNQAMLDTHIGRLSFHIGHASSRLHTERGLLSLRKYLHNQNHKSIARALAYLGVEIKASGDYEKSEQLLEESVVLYRKFYSQYVLEHAYALLLLGSTYIYTGKFEKAKNVLEQSANLYKSKNNTMGLVRVNGCLADTYLVLGNYKYAMSIYEENLNINKKYFSKNYNQILWGMVRLSLAHKGMGEYKKAEKVLQEACDLYPTLLPENIQDLGCVFMYLSDVSRLLGCYKKAEKLMEESLTINNKYCNKDSSSTILLEVFYAQLLLDIGHYNKAKKLLVRCFKIYETTHSAYHPKVGWAAYNLANAYTFSRDFDKAEVLFNKSLGIYERHYGLKHPDYAIVLCDFGHFFLLKNDYEKAENLIKQAMKILQANSHTSYYRCLEYLGDIYDAKNKNSYEQRTLTYKKYQKQAITYFQQAITVVKDNFPKESEHISRLQGKLKKLFA